MRQWTDEDYRFGYQGLFAELDKETGLNHFKSRNNDGITGRWLAVDPQGQFSSAYVGMGNLPHLGVDPDGEALPAFVLPLIIGAVLGGTSQGLASVENGGRFIDGFWKGALIGALAGATGGAVTSLVGSSLAVSGAGTIAAAAGGATGGAISGGLTSVVNGGKFLDGAWKGGLAGLAGGGIGAYIGGGIGAFSGGFVSGSLGTALNGGDLGESLLGGVLGGAFSYGMFEFSMHQAYNKTDKSWNYKQYRKLSVATQRSFARGREIGGWITDDDVILDKRMGKRNHIPNDRMAERPGKVATRFHTHPNKGKGWVEDFSNQGVKSDVGGMRIRYTLDRLQGRSTSYYVFGRNNSYFQTGFGADFGTPSTLVDKGLYRYPFLHNLLYFKNRRR